MSNHRTIREQDRGMELVFELERVVARATTEHQEIVVADTVAYGRALFLDGDIQSAQSDEALYHEPLVHPALVLHGKPGDVLVAGAGEGATLREILKHPSVQRVTTVDLDASVIDVARTHLPTWHQGAFDDPRVTLRLDDIRDVLTDIEADTIDAVILDLTTPHPDGPSDGVLVPAFFEEVARVLRPDGVVSMQSGKLDLVDPASIQAVWAMVRQVFEDVRLVPSYVPSFHSLWGFLVASKRALDVHPADLSDRIKALSGCRVYDEPRHDAWFARPALFRRFEPSLE